MKAILAKDMDGANPAFDRSKPAGPDNAPCVEQPEGTMIDHPDAWKLVQCGVARPHDDECAAKAGLDDAEIERRIERHSDLERGVGLDLNEDDYDELEDEDNLEPGFTEILI